MKAVALFGLMLVVSNSTWAASAEDNVMKELVPTGKLRVGVAYAPSPTPIFVAKDAAGDVRGVPATSVLRSRKRLACLSRSS
jgi:polar amino acid transport system substrate-binding protein